MAAGPLVIVLETEDRRPAIASVLDRFNARVEYFDNARAAGDYAAHNHIVLAIIAIALDPGWIARNGSRHAVPIIVLYEKNSWGAKHSRPASVHRTPFDAKTFEAACASVLQRRAISKQDATVKLRQVERELRLALEQFVNAGRRSSEADREVEFARRERDDRFEEYQRQYQIALQFYASAEELNAAVAE